MIVNSCYTIDLGISSTHVLNGTFYSLPYDVLNDFEPISPLVTSAGGLYARRTRATGSKGPPAGNGTIMVIGRDG
jgi:hypothetical protein